MKQHKRSFGSSKVREFGSSKVWGRHSSPRSRAQTGMSAPPWPVSSLASLDGGRWGSTGSAGVDRGRVPERFMERAQASGARGLRGMITAGRRTPPPGTAGSTLRLSRSPGTVYTISHGSTGSTGRFGSAGRWRDKAWRQGVETRCKCEAPTPNPLLNSLLSGTLTPPA